MSHWVQPASKGRGFHRAGIPGGRVTGSHVGSCYHSSNQATEVGVEDVAEKGEFGRVSEMWTATLVCSNPAHVDKIYTY